MSLLYPAKTLQNVNIWPLKQKDVYLSMSITRQRIKSFLEQKRGYLKKAPLETAKALWTSSSFQNIKSKAQIEKDLFLIKGVMQEIKRKNIEKAAIKAYTPPKILFLDLETSPNVVFAWRTGYNITLQPDSIIKERAIICASFSWGGEKKVSSFRWNNGDDKELVKELAKIVNEADILVAQNGDRFDIKWFRTRCIFHNIPLKPKINSIDTLKMAKAGFYFNSNKLDYMGQFLGVGKKIGTEYSLWKDICLNNCTKSMDKMVKYCEGDIKVLKGVYYKLQPYCPEKKFKPTK